MLDIRQAAPEDLGAIQNLLSLCLLPHQDVGDGRATFFVAESERGVIGVAGFENCGDSKGVLRSLAVMPGYRKQQIARQLLQRLLAHAEKDGVSTLYLLTEVASDYFQQMGFVAADGQEAPARIQASGQFSDLCPHLPVLMSRSVRGAAGARMKESSAAIEIGVAARRHFDAGYHCAESVLLAIAERLRIASPLLPAIATGFGNGSTGTCGALIGGVMAVNLVYGRQKPGQALTDNMRMVHRLIDDFNTSCGSTLCAELVADDPAPTDGRRVPPGNRVRCREFAGTAARLAAALIEERVSLSADNASRAA